MARAEVSTWGGDFSFTPAVVFSPLWGANQAATIAINAAMTAVPSHSQHAIARGRRYLAGCACGESQELDTNYAGDISALHALGFSAAKFDNCGAMKNLTKYAELMKATGKNYTIENCHWGHCWDQGGDPDASGCPTEDWCPFVSALRLPARCALISVLLAR